MTTRKHVLLLLPTALAGTVILAACGGTGGGDGAAPTTEQTATAAADFNDTDAEFARMMIPHHEQAVEMSDLAEKNQAGTQVQDLADKISAAQGPEVRKLKGMLTTWGEKPLSDDAAAEVMDGMLTPDQMADLRKATGTEFDQLYLELMVEHHEGAVEMAQKEIHDGVNADAMQMAEDIVDAQESEISSMKGMLGDSGTDGGRKAAADG
ncbi:DUF305 domain-containing protein [Nocardiopsis gilva YIM 90087]|uniref:DUF305 domain-containing protein n=1 Tax=Nocardiopsis gilva YIM 90087 TaxID=1235441 RepID=A0A223SE33_9ACTN|nr:DUF305 domain-containing protein [Nocardiopsis gilva]ASU86398.1 DUF305 domain-containing protein [Nocardiopsis gilva YIM 90087]